MILGLFIFLAGAVAGSLFDTLLFKGGAWEHSFVGMLDTPPAITTASQTGQLSTGPDLNTELPSSPEKKTEPENLGAGNSHEPGEGIASETVIDEEPVKEIGSNTVGDNAARVELQNEPSGSESPMVEAPTVENESTATQIDSTSLVFKEVVPMVKGDFNSYHGFVARDSQEMVFAADKVKIGQKSLYQCFVASPSADVDSTRAFEWPGNVWTPELTPDRKKIVFSSDSRSPEHVFVYDREKGQSKALTSGTSKNMMPSISPDGSLVAYVSNEKGNNDIWLVGIDGSNKLQITTGAEDDREPRWLPDGRGLIFTRIFERLKRSSIMKIMLDPMGEAQPLVQNGGRNWLGDISPDARSLVFVRSLSDNGSKNTILIKNLENQTEREIKPLGDAECFRPIWLPDSLGLVFHANVNRSKNIYKAVMQMENEH
jgi:Tol biopolymer transport system component